MSLVSEEKGFYIKYPNQISSKLYRLQLSSYVWENNFTSFLPVQQKKEHIKTIFVCCDIMNTILI